MGCGASSEAAAGATAPPGALEQPVLREPVVTGAEAVDHSGGQERASASIEPVEEVEYQYVPIPKYVDKAVLEFFKGNSHAAVGNLQEAISCFDAAIREKPDYSTAFHQRGLAFFQLLRYEQALKDFDRAIELNPSYGRAYNSRAAVHVEMKAYSKAVEDATVGISLSPKDPEGFLARAEANSELGDLEKADADREAASQLEGNSLCNVCLTEPRGTRLHPCLHSCMCANCARTLEEKGFPCPICQEPIAHIEYGVFDQTFAFSTLYSKTAKNPIKSLIGQMSGLPEEETIQEGDEEDPEDHTNHEAEQIS
ncbi:stress-induced-phosphoprotein 1 [Klebsormidium nitens]|uniref:Stress-induced-phosphoprotein 1 n=1 Tax=Klebsormidium nitens TaxID=105231 RepID=A0A1Y1HTF2_KLENI|nr:stress-induced-phosphoprotein 1 [Klebsormidium nitens]|eukprot:GAQ81905.1 stress-induced-phosphoprotein 1 [Klebsormidium nitens]